MDWRVDLIRSHLQNARNEVVYMLITAQYTFKHNERVKKYKKWWAAQLSAVEAGKTDFTYFIIGPTGHHVPNIVSLKQVVQQPGLTLLQAAH